MRFREMLDKRQKEINSLVCVGLDPEWTKCPQLLVEKHAKYEAAGRSYSVIEWMTKIIDATADYACMYKPNIAFWEDFIGLYALEEVMVHIKKKYPQIPVFMDCKRGDIDKTQKHYGSAILTGFGADGMNFSPYMGRSCMAALVQPNDPGKALVGLCYTSNPDAREIQDLIFPNKGCPGIHLWEVIAGKILAWAEDLGVVSDAGLVMAAAYEPKKGSGEIFSEHLTKCRQIVGVRLWFLIPGIGTQGGFIEETVKAAFAGSGSIAINSSSGITNASAGPDFAQAAAVKAKELRDQIRAAGGNV